MCGEKWHRITGSVILLIALLASGLLTACTGAKPEPDKITVELSWLHTVEFAGFYVAQQQGYYAEENLEVELVPFSFDTPPTTTVAEGRAEFGVAGGDQLLIARSQGQPLQAVATIFRQSPVALMALADSEIRTPEDMVGKRIGIFSPELDNVNDIQLLATLQRKGIDRSQVEFVLIEDYSVGSLTSGAMDVYSGFSVNEAVDAEMQGIDLNLLFPQDYGVLIYANALFTRQQLIDENPDLVERFVRATLKGYRYAIEHPDEATDITVKYDETLSKEPQLASMKAEIPLVDTGDAPIGTMDEDVWHSTHDILLEQGFLSSPVDLKTVYTNQFVKKTY